MTESPRHERALSLLALLTVGAVAIAATLAFAVTWAADQPRTLRFAIAREPFGPRSMLERGNARAGLRRVLERLDATDRVTDLHLTADRLSLTVRDARDRRRWLTTSIRGEVEDVTTQGPPEGRGVPSERIAAVDLDAALRAAERRWSSLRPRTEGPLLSLRAGDGRPRGWTVTFTSDVPQPERVGRIDIHGRIVR